MLSAGCSCCSLFVCLFSMHGGPPLHFQPALQLSTLIFKCLNLGKQALSFLAHLCYLGPMLLLKRL